MADQKITDLTAILAAALVDGDLFVTVDVSDVSMAPTGTDKKITKAELKKIITEEANTFLVAQTFFAGFKIMDAAEDHTIQFISNGNEVSDRQILIPLLGGGQTMALLGVDQTFTGNKVFSRAIQVIRDALTGSVAYLANSSELCSVSIICDESGADYDVRMIFDAGGDAGLMFRSRIVGGVSTVSISSTESGNNLSLEAETTVELYSESTGGFNFYDSDVSHKILIRPGNESANRTLTIPVLGGNHTFAFIALAQTWGAIQTFGHGFFKLRDSGNDHSILIQSAADNAADRTVSIPALAANDTFALLGKAQTFSETQTIAATKSLAFAGTGSLTAVAGQTFDVGSGQSYQFKHLGGTVGSIIYYSYIDAGAGLSIGGGKVEIINDGSTYEEVRFDSVSGNGLQVNMKRRATPTASAANIGSWYTTPVNSVTECFAQNEADVPNQLTGLCKQLASDATNATATMANLTDLTIGLRAGKKYTGRMIVYLANSLAADGAKFDFDGGTATMTSFRAHATLYDTALLKSQQTSAIATDITQATVTGDAMLEVNFSFVCNAAGTFIPRFAGNSAVSGTLTAYKCSSIELRNAA